MPLKRKLLASFFTILLLAVLSVQPAFASSSTVLKSGMKGSAVSVLQKELKTLGFMSISPTGYFGSTTKAAVIRFQKKYGITPDGIAGSKTLGKINKLLVSKTTASRSSSASSALKSGMKGSAVSALQKNLKILGFMSISPTGYFGSLTKTAVIRFQKKYGITPDGIAGPKTLGKISNLLGSRTTSSRGSSGSAAQDIVDYAKRFTGVKYVWGGDSPEGFDCSGFVSYVYKKFGINLDHSAAGQATQGTTVRKADLEPADLVFFDTNGGHNGINHVGIYIGGGRFIHASSGCSYVTISDITGGFYSDTYMTAKRILR